MPNRAIFSNLFTIREIINYSNTKNINSYNPYIDQEKAYDKVGRILIPNNAKIRIL